MKYQYDMQTHSTLSDGDYGILELIKRAKKAGLRGLIITDHNVLVDMEKKMAAAKKLGLETLMGVEITSKTNKAEIHILGYGKKLDLTQLTKGLKKTVAGYNSRAAKSTKLLKKAGIVDLNFKKILQKRGKGLAITKYDLAKEAAPILKINNREAQKLVSSGGAGFVTYGDWTMTPIAAIRLIHKAGGVAIMAHPGETYKKLTKKMSKKKAWAEFKKLAAILIKNKLDGFEINIHKNDLKTKKYCLELIKKHGLLMTGGSDYHGAEHHPEWPLGSGGLTEKQYREFTKRL